MLPHDDLYPSAGEPIEALLDGFPFEHVPALVCYVDASGVSRRMSAAWEEWFGLDRGEVVGRHYAEVILRLFGFAPFYQIDAAMRRALAGECTQAEGEFPYPRGPRYVRACYTPDLDATGTVRGVLLLVHDLSELKRAEQAARENERRYREVVENAPVKMWLNRADGTPYWYNAEWRRYTGQPGRLEGTMLAQAVHPEDWAWYRPLREAAIAAGAPYEGRIRLLCAEDESWRWHECRLSPLRDEEGDGIWGWVGVAIEMHDGTEP